VVKNLLLCYYFFLNFVSDVNFLFIQEHGLSQPFLVKDCSGLSFRYVKYRFVFNVCLCLM